jgi:hypothetical protein
MPQGVVRSARRTFVQPVIVFALHSGLLCCRGFAQAPLPDAPPAPAVPTTQSSPQTSATPDAPDLGQTPEQIASAKEDERKSLLGTVNGRLYDQPSHKDQFLDYVHDTYGWGALARSTVRTLYGEGRDAPSGWGQDLPGFMQRFGSNLAVTAIVGNVRYGMETLFREDMRYIPCHGCSKKKKLTNALFAEFTARHDIDGRRFFTLTPVISDFSGPLIANAFWYPNHDPIGGLVGTRTVVATRVGQHLFTEFIWERRHKDPKLEDDQIRTPPKTSPATPPTLQPHPATPAPPTQP